jgi:hypothetical protein
MTIVGVSSCNKNAQQLCAIEQTLNICNLFADENIFGYHDLDQQRASKNLSVRLSKNCAFSVNKYFA